MKYLACVPRVWQECLLLLIWLCPYAFKMVTFLKYFSEDICLLRYTWPLNNVIMAVMGICLCVSSRIWTRGSLPDLAPFCVPFDIPSFRSPRSRDLNARCQPSPMWTGSMDRFSIQALFSSCQCPRCILSNGPQVVILTPLTNFLSFSFLLLGTLLPSPQHPGSFSVPAAVWVQTQLRRWWWQWETLRSKWGRAKKRRREAAWSSSLRKENGRVRWTADGWDGLFRSADRGEEETQGKWSHGLCCDCHCWVGVISFSL